MEPRECLIELPHRFPARQRDVTIRIIHRRGEKRRRRQRQRGGHEQPDCDADGRPSSPRIPLHARVQACGLLLRDYLGRGSFLLQLPQLALKSRDLRFGRRTHNLMIAERPRPQLRVREHGLE